MDSSQILSNIKYGEHENQYLNIFLPKIFKTKTFIIMVHGGGWKGGCKEQYNLTGIKLAEAGIASATIGYRLLPEGVFPNSSFDILNGYQKVIELSKEFSFSTDKVITWGSSAGGHIALMLQYYQEKWKNEKVVKNIPNVIGTVAQCPVINFEENWYLNIHRKEYSGETPFELVSPLHMAPANFKSILLVQGDKDDTTPLVYAETFIKNINHAGSKSKLMIIKDAVHGYGYTAYNDHAKQSILAGIEYILKLN